MCFQLSSAWGKPIETEGKTIRQIINVTLYTGFEYI